MRNINLENVPIVVPSWSNFGHSVVTIRVVGFGPLGVTEGTAADGVNTDEEDDNDDVEDGELMPVPSNVLKDTRLTRVAFVAQQVTGIVPPVAVGILSHHRPRRHHVVVAHRWRLATT